MVILQRWAGFLFDVIILTRSRMLPVVSCKRTCLKKINRLFNFDILEWAGHGSV